MRGSGEPPFSATARFGYFVLQAQVANTRSGVALTGVLENLGTGEKHAFAGGDALARLLEDWSQAGPVA